MRSRGMMDDKKRSSQKCIRYTAVYTKLYDGETLPFDVLFDGEVGKGRYAMETWMCYRFPNEASGQVAFIPLSVRMWRMV